MTVFRRRERRPSTPTATPASSTPRRDDSHLYTDSGPSHSDNSSSSSSSCDSSSSSSSSSSCGD